MQPLPLRIDRRPRAIWRESIVFMQPETHTAERIECEIAVEVFINNFFKSRIGFGLIGKRGERREQHREQETGRAQFREHGADVIRRPARAEGIKRGAPCAHFARG